MVHTAGVIGTVTSAVIACKATTKVGKIVEETKSDVEEIHNAVEKGVTNAGEKYTADDSKKDLTIVYALAAAYATVDKGFKDYRSRVIERFGAEVDRELKNNVKAKKVDVIEKDPETGKDKKVKKQQFVVSPSDISGYARFFEQYTMDEEGNTILNRNWESNNEYNLMFLKAQERYANDLLKSKKRLFLNEVYEMLGLPPTKAGQIVGWVYDPENPSGDNYVDFGLYADNLTYSDFVNGHEPAILLDFNVDGNIWDKMPA